MTRTDDTQHPRHPLRAAALALLAGLAVATVGAAPARAAEVIDTITVSAGAGSDNVGHVPLNGKYRMIITGSTRRELGPDFSAYDAFYCFQSSAGDSACNQGGFPQDTVLSFGLQLGSDTPSVKTTFNFIDPTPYPAINNGHTYDVPFTASGGTLLYVVTWTDLIPSQGEQLTGSFTIQIVGEPTKEDKSIGKCQQTIHKSSAEYFEARIKALGKCAKAKLTDKLADTVDCAVDVKTHALIVKAQAKLEGEIDRACGGPDKVCHTADDVPLAKTGFGPACPDYAGVGCTNPIRDCDDISACLLCIDAFAADQALRVISNYAPADPKIEKGINKCQQKILDAGLDFVNAFAALYQKCTALDLKHKHDPFCISGKAGTRISNLEGTLNRAIAKECASEDDRDHNFSVAEIGITGKCPALRSLINPTTCYKSKFGAVIELGHCIDCVVQQQGVCLSFAASPTNQQEYPQECFLPPVPF